jgi:hypothetical protein
VARAKAAANTTTGPLTFGAGEQLLTACADDELDELRDLIAATGARTQVEWLVTELGRQATGAPLDVRGEAGSALIGLAAALTDRDQVAAALRSSAPA